MVQSYKQKFNIKYKQDKNKSNSIQEIAKLSGYKIFLFTQKVTCVIIYPPE